MPKTTLITIVGLVGLGLIALLVICGLLWLSARLLRNSSERQSANFAIILSVLAVLGMLYFSLLTSDPPLPDERFESSAPAHHGDHDGPGSDEHPVESDEHPAKPDVDSHPLPVDHQESISEELSINSRPERQLIKLIGQTLQREGCLYAVRFVTGSETEANHEFVTSLNSLLVPSDAPQTDAIDVQVTLDNQTLDSERRVTRVNVKFADTEHSFEATGLSGPNTDAPSGLATGRTFNLTVGHSKWPAISREEAHLSASRSAAVAIDSIIARHAQEPRSRSSTDRVDWIAERIHAGVLVEDQFSQQVKKSYGELWRVSLLVDANPNALMRLIRDYIAARDASVRSQIRFSGVLTLITGLIGGLYLFLNVATQGYYTRRLRVLAICVLLCAIAISGMLTIAA